MGDDTLKEEAAAKVSWDGQSQASSITALVAKSAVAQIKEASEKSRWAPGSLLATVPHAA